MSITPTQHGIKMLFEQIHSFRVPKYQRGYAWYDTAVSDFLADLNRCLRARQSGQRVNHFFGGIVAARAPVSNSHRTNYEVIDGQQRLASFVLFVARLTHKLASVISEMAKHTELSAKEKKAQNFLPETLAQLRALYLTYRDNVGMEYVDVPKLILSEADGDFFQALIDGEPIDCERASHERLEAAWSLMGNFIED